MKFRIKRRNIIPFLSFFLITIGNGKYINDIFGDEIEYLGLVLLVYLCFSPLNKFKKNIIIQEELNKQKIINSMNQNNIIKLNSNNRKQVIVPITFNESLKVI